MHRIEIVRVVDKLFLREQINDVHNRLRTDKGERHAVQAFDECVSSFEQEARLRKSDESVVLLFFYRG